MTAVAKARRKESESGSKDYQDAVLAAISVLLIGVVLIQE